MVKPWKAAGNRPYLSWMTARASAKTVADFLGMEGYHVLQAASVDEARGQLELKPDLILLDIKMPGGDGLTFTGEIRRQSSIPIIIISAKGDTVDRIVGLEVGADDYLPSPSN